ncbi:MAG: calcineurin-like phosphoesterase C-terminal domain-containing protein [Balneolaceae bacterium]
MIRFSRLTILLIVFTCFNIPLQAQQFARGIVFEDRNGNGVQDSGEPGIAGVMVSNQIDVTVTDENGRYRLPLDGNGIVFATKPSGYNFPLNNLNIPQFYYVHRPDGSPDLEYDGVEPTGPLPESLNFGFQPSETKNEFTVITFGDPQPRNDRELSFYRDKIVSELAETRSEMVLVLGDIMYDNLALFERYNRLMATLDRPVFNVYGNHDMNFDADGNDYARETFHRHYGPSYYSFDVGDVHFIILDNIDYLGYNDEGQPQYRGNINDRQINWLEQNLAHVDTGKRIVLSAHIPLFTPGLEDLDVVNTANRRELIRLLEPFDHVLFLSGHMHTNFHNFLGREFGRDNPTPIHQIISSAASGSWWGGPPDKQGIPAATQRDGTPNGYHFIHFKGITYSEIYKAAGHDPSYQMRIESPPAEIMYDNMIHKLLVNIFNGSEHNEVKYQINNSDWMEMKRLNLAVSPFFQNLRAMYDDTFAGWIQPVQTTHIWQAGLGEVLKPGAHRITVWTRDMYGNEFTQSKIVEVHKQTIDEHK